MEVLKRLLDREVLDRAAAHELMAAVMDGQATEAQVGALLAVYRMRDPTVDELAGFATAMREACVRLPTERTDLVDTCGTGGAIVKTFNASTLAGLVVAACGVPVAKHGNRSVTSKCGSADLMEALGADLEASPEAVGRALDESNFTFLFAPAFHPAMRHAVGPRRELGVATVFNMLGPLSNPARPRAQLMGVGDPEMLELVPPTLAALGTDAVVVHGEPGLDEVSTIGPTRVVRVLDGTIEEDRIEPADVGIELATADQIGSLDPAESAAEARRILAGGDGPRADLVALTAAGALLAADAVVSWKEGVERAREALADGRAHTTLETYLAALAGPEDGA